MGFPDDLPEEIAQRFKQRRKQAEDEFARKVGLADRAGRHSIGFGLDIDLRNPFGREAALAPHQKKAALEYVAEIILFLIDACSSAALSSEELQRQVSVWLSLLRDELIEHKWPVSINKKFMGRPLIEQEVDRALIRRLEEQDGWQKYEARILPELATSEVAHPSRHEPPTPLFYMGNWGLEPLPPRAIQKIKAGLLEIHGQVLDRQLSGDAATWRAAYDLIAEGFWSARILSEQVLNAHIPGLVADASAAGGWAIEPFSRTEPTAIYSIRCGSLFYPLWRVLSLLQGLQGRISYWRGRQLLGDAEGAGVQNSTAVKPEAAAAALKRHRRAIVDRFKKRHELESLEFVARRLGVSETALQGMIRGDARRYSREKLELVLGKFECTKADWDHCP